ncbi:MAG TPA: hypothetical protein VGO47_15035, partial [Chlamydiales bacterium]|nr:hypothetical protein [Chlamydiales bacterium]
MTRNVLETFGRSVEFKDLIAGVMLIPNLQSSEAPHVCHLAVHPSAWTSAPPNSTVSQRSENEPLQQYSQSYSTRPGFTPSPTVRPTMPGIHANPRVTYLYIQHLHTNALRILARQRRITWPEQYGSLEDARAVARRGVEGA